MVITATGISRSLRQEKYTHFAFVGLLACLAEIIGMPHLLQPLSNYTPLGKRLLAIESRQNFSHLAKLDHVFGCVCICMRVFQGLFLE